MGDYTKRFANFGPRYLGRSLESHEGENEAEAIKAEVRLGVKLPEAMRDYYLTTGRCAELNKIHNELLPLRDLEVNEGYLVFMHENQAVVSWGTRVEDLANPDPVVWQRNNTPPEEWFSEEMRFSAFMESMFDWYKSEDVWRHAL